MMENRVLIAWVLIGVLAVLGVAGAAVALRHCRRKRLRRRGIKTYGH